MNERLCIFIINMLFASKARYHGPCPFVLKNSVYCIRYYALFALICLFKVVFENVRLAF